jgi:two-component system CheB/CheR fusion protein
LQDNERARAEAEAAGHAKDHFLAVLSHELRTPLTPAMMICDMLLEEDEKLSELARDGLETIRRNVKLEAHFIDDLLDVTRISRGKLELASEPLDLHEAVRGAVEITQPDIEANAQTLTVELSANECRVRGDFPRLQQVFWNLLKNAAKFTPERGAVGIVTRNEPGHIVVEISDTGCGIDPNVLPNIFEAFRQGDESITRKFGGLGLGLAISKATIDAHEGTIVAASLGQGHGSTFTVRLPLLDDSDEMRSV